MSLLLRSACLLLPCVLVLSSTKLDAHTKQTSIKALWPTCSTNCTSNHTGNTEPGFSISLVGGTLTANVESFGLTDVLLGSNPDTATTCNPLSTLVVTVLGDSDNTGCRKRILYTWHLVDVVSQGCVVVQTSDESTEFIATVIAVDQEFAGQVQGVAYCKRLSHVKRTSFVFPATYSLPAVTFGVVQAAKPELAFASELQFSDVAKLVRANVILSLNHPYRILTTPTCNNSCIAPASLQLKHSEGCEGSNLCISLYEILVTGEYCQQQGTVLGSYNFFFEIGCRESYTYACPLVTTQRSASLTISSDAKLSSCSIPTETYFPSIVPAATLNGSTVSAFDENQDVTLSVQIVADFANPVSGSLLSVLVCEFDSAGSASQSACQPNASGMTKDTNAVGGYAFSGSFELSQSAIQVLSGSATLAISFPVKSLVTSSSDQPHHVSFLRLEVSVDGIQFDMAQQKKSTKFRKAVQAEDGTNWQPSAKFETHASSFVVLAVAPKVATVGPHQDLRPLPSENPDFQQVDSLIYHAAIVLLILMVAAWWRHSTAGPTTLIRTKEF